MRTTSLAAVLCLGITGLPLQAASLVELQDQNGRSRIYAEGDKGRIESDRDASYLIVNGTRIYSVMPSERMVLDMSDAMPSVAPADSDTRVQTNVEEEGAGPTIAGYATRQYRYTANGKPCGTLYSSKAAMRDAGVQHMMMILHQMSERAMGAMGQFAGAKDPCDLADRQLTKHVGEMGMPLRSVNPQGQVENEVLRIEKRTKLPANAFSVPGSYRVQSMAQMQQQMRGGMQPHGQGSMPSGMPNMEELMKQMPKDGSLPPEAMERMRQMQEIMKRQYQGN
jgi:hypothetical protein